MAKADKGFGVIIVIIVIILVALHLRKPPAFEIATVGNVNYNRFSMEIPKEWVGLTYIEISPVVGKYGRIFIAPTEDYNLPWSQLKENIIAGKYRELTSAELEAYWIA